MRFYDDMDFLRNACTICFMISIAALLLSAVMFFVLDIRGIIMIETGRARRKAVREIEDRNHRAGIPGNDARPGRKNRTEKMADTSRPVQYLQRMDPGKIDSRTGKEKDTEDLRPGRAGAPGAEPCGNLENRRDSGFRIIQKTIVVHTKETIFAGRGKNIVRQPGRGIFPAGNKSDEDHVL